MRIAVSSLGCKTNQYEMDALAEILEALGHDVVNENDIAVYVLNTCTVTAEAERNQGSYYGASGARTRRFGGGHGLLFRTQ